MNELIERLEKATGPERKHDRAISVWLVENGCDPDGPDKGMHPRLHNVPPYTASLDAALTLVPAEKHWRICIMTGLPRAIVCNPNAALSMGSAPTAHHGATPAIALCIAALKARSAS